MKKIIVYLLISVVVIACSESADEQKTKTVDTTILGSDNPNPSFDSTRADSLKK